LPLSNVKLGGNASVAAGPVGIGVEGATPITMSADMVSFVRAKGAYAGASLDGALIKISNNANKAYYGEVVRPVDIFVKRTVSNSGSALLRNVLNRASK
jgi:lipid-binding SYLF domain-containing protein